MVKGIELEYGIEILKTYKYKNVFCILHHAKLWVYPYKAHQLKCFSSHLVVACAQFVEAMC